MRVIIRPTSRMQWVKQPPPPYVRGKVEKVGGWIINHEEKSISIDYEWSRNGRTCLDLHTVLSELNDLETFPMNVAYFTENGPARPISG